VLKEGVMRRIRTIIPALIGVTAVAAGMALLAPTAYAATIPVACSENALVAAINSANSNPDATTLALAGGCTYSMRNSHGSAANGQEALPVITTPIEMIGPGGLVTITRSSGALFRIAEVSKTGSLTLTNQIALTNGNTLGNGGAILNFGAVTLTGSSLSRNTAQGYGGGLANANTPTGTAPAASFTSSRVFNNTAFGSGGGIYNGVRSTLTFTGISALDVTGNRSFANGGGIAAINSTATTLTNTAVTVNTALGGRAGGVFRQGGVMTTTTSPITANTPNNCVGSVPAVPHCTA
jgi:hypothetical protein